MDETKTRVYYIAGEPEENGSYGTIQSTPYQGALALPETLLSAYVAARGFVRLTVDGSTVTALEVNQKALDAYLAEHPDREPEGPTPTQLDRVEAQVMYTAMMTDTLLEEG